MSLIDYDNAIISLIPENAKRILILGGGDCSLANQLCKKSWVEKITICEIDPAVPEICRRHFNISLNDKVQFVFEDCFKFIRNAQATDYDVIIDDMLPTPHHSSETYWVDLAKAFRGIWIISETDDFNTKTPFIIKQALKDLGAEIKQIDCFVPTFCCNWTFTAYRLT